MGSHSLSLQTPLGLSSLAPAHLPVALRHGHFAHKASGFSGAWWRILRLGKVYNRKSPAISSQSQPFALWLELPSLLSGSPLPRCKLCSSWEGVKRMDLCSLSRLPQVSQPRCSKFDFSGIVCMWGGEGHHSVPVLVPGEGIQVLNRISTKGKLPRPRAEAGVT